MDTAANEAGVAVENNALYKEHIDTYLKLIYENRSTKEFDEYTFIKEVIMPAMAENSEQTYKEFDACISSPQASSCLPRIQNRLKQTDYTALLREVSIIPEAYNQVLAYAQRNHDLAYCNESSGNGCLNLAQFKRNVESGVFFPAISARGVRTPTPKPETASKTSRNTATCTTGTVCFTAGTLIETDKGLKAIETFTGGELIWTRNDITLEYGYRPVIATKATPNQPIFQVTVKNQQGDIETLQTTAEHPFWIKDTGWLKASLLEQGMILLDRNNQEVEVISQFVLPNHTDTVYNIEVDDFHTYHVGRLGVWVHNADCCGVDVKTSPLPVAEAKKSEKIGETYKSNPKHTLGQTGNRPNAGIEPRNSFELFEESKIIGKQIFSVDENGDIHRFMNSNSPDGWHWAGSTADKSALLQLTNEQKATLKRLFPEHKSNKRLK
ncbi:polymorphic toxin-type HINT domain-containing protein [Moraxella bovoculi]|uniref:polymorphic toxin-type HINT domain-containing protein n=1 Tax=Moraxella bovoculi TaxID=386891 RepID=UPI003F502AAD